MQKVGADFQPDFCAGLTAGTVVVSPGNEFPREARLTSPAHYRRVFEKNERQSDRFWTLLYRENGLGYSRLGLAVSKKRAKRAVDRNRLKRLLRETFRSRDFFGCARHGITHTGRIDSAGNSGDDRIENRAVGVDIVAMVRDASIKADNETLITSLNRQWNRISERCTRSCVP